MRARQKIVALVCFALPLMSAAAYAKPDIQLTMTAEKEVTVTEGGKKLVKRVPAQSSTPGEVLIYTLSYKNVGDEKATAVKVDNPLPAGARYVADSATGAGADITFSVDGGKSFAKPDQLMVEKTKAGQKEKNRAEAIDYTTIRWVIAEIAPGKSGQLAFKAQVQ